VEQQLAAYKQLVKAVAGATTDDRIGAAVESFEALFFNNLTLVMDRYFVHRLPGADYEGDPVRLTDEEFERLSGAFFAELERRFL
jgi:hypothetical protein